MRSLVAIAVACGAPPPAHHVEPMAPWFQGPLHHDGLEAVAISADGTRAASGAFDGRVIVWDVAAGTSIATLRTDQDNVHGVALSAAGDRVAVAGTGHLGSRAGARNTLEMWDVAGGHRLWASRHGGLHLAFVGERLISHIGDTASVIDAATGESIATRFAHDEEYHRESPRPVVGISPGLDTVVETHAIDWRTELGGDYEYDVPGTYEVRVFTAGKQSEPRVYEHENEPVFVAVDDTRVAVASRFELRVIARDSGAAIATFPIVADGVDTATFAGGILFGWGTRGSAVLRAWDVASKREVWNHNSHYDAHPQIAAGDIVVYRDDAACVARRLADGVELWRHTRCMAFGTAAGHAVAIAGDNSFAVVDASTGR